MNRNQILNEIHQMLNNRLNEYKDINAENMDLYCKLSKLIQEKIQNNSLDMNHALISRVDDILEDIVTANISMKLLKYVIENNMNITTSEREQERIQRQNSLRNQNILPSLFILLSTLNENQ